jgi:CelD/BcsL family acetyltransferase involved in cellulose biosynthesis
MHFSAVVVPGTAMTTAQSAAWDQMCMGYSHLDSPFYSPHYTLAVAAVRPLVYVCEIKAGTETVGFFPFQFRNSWYRVLGSAERIGEEMTDYFGLIADPNLRCDERQLLRLAKLKHLYFSHLPESHRYTGWTAESPSSGLAIRLDQTYWDRLKRVNSKAVKETERLAERLESAYGCLRFCFAESNWELPLRNLIRFKRHQYTRTGRPDLFAERWKRDLLHRLATVKQPSCRGILSTLYAGDTWVAFHFGLRNQHTLHYWFPVYNRELKKFSPGRQLERLIIQHAPHEGIRVVDHGVGESYAKRFVCNAEHLFYRGACFQPGLRSLLARGAWSLNWRLEAFAAKNRD